MEDVHIWRRPCFVTRAAARLRPAKFGSDQCQHGLSFDRLSLSCSSPRWPSRGRGGRLPRRTYTPATPEPGTDIPKVSVSFGMRPYADNTFYVIGIEKGWFKDVGITITPEPDGLKTTENQWVSLLLNRQVDINSATCSNLLPSYKSTDQLKCVGFAVTFSGSVMFANPKLGLKRLTDYMTPGVTPEAGAGRGAQAAARQDGLHSDLDFGEGVHRSPVQAGRARSAELRHDGRLRRCCCSPRAAASTSCIRSGAPIAQTLLDAGWTPIYDSAQLLKYRSGRDRFSVRAAGVQQRLGGDRRLRRRSQDHDDALRLGRVPHLRRAEEGSLALRRLSRPT